jgi:hypothetical protein
VRDVFSLEPVLPTGTGISNATGRISPAPAGWDQKHAIALLQGWLMCSIMAAVAALAAAAAGAAGGL